MCRVFLGFWFTLACFHPAVWPQTPPNFVVIIADDMAWNDAGAYGHPRIKTPNIDRLAREGMRFDRAFLTTSSCSPSRSSILTGRYPHSTDAGELHLPLPASQVLVTEPLRELGYYTASAGKWHLGDAVRDRFDDVKGGRPSGCEEWVSTLAERPKSKPFFLWLAAFDPHRAYEENTIPEPHRPEEVVVPPFLPDVAETRTDLALYYDEIARMDGYIGDVLAELERQGVANDTCVIFLSDNGRPFPRCKTTLYDSGVQTPFIVRFPKSVKPGSVCERIVSSVDLSPTILDLAGSAPQTTMQGESFAALLAKPDTPHREWAFAEHNWHDFTARERSVRSEQYLYIWNDYPDLPGTPPADAVRSITYQKMVSMKSEGTLLSEQLGTFVMPRLREEFYDIAADPFNLKNVINDPRYADVISQHRRAREVWQRETDDGPPPQRRPDEFDRTTGKRLSSTR